jgi:hypothetical protein
MVVRICLTIGAIACMTGCDPFAAGEPETPSGSLDIPLAALAKDVPGIWAAALAARSTERVNAIASEQLVVAQAGKNISGAGLTNCVVERLFNRDSLVAPLWKTSSWIQEPTSSSDTVLATMEYTLSKGVGARLAHGQAIWTVVRVSPSEWRLWRWDDDASSDSSMFSFCQGGAH